MTNRDLLNQISELHKNQEHNKIIKIIENLPKDEQTSDILSLLARAYMNIEEFPNAITILDRINESEQNGLYCVRYGLALFISHKEHEALVWFEKANKMGIKEFDELPGTYYPTTMAKWLERARLWAPRRAEKLAFEKERREKRNKLPQEASAIDEATLDNLWDDCDYSLEKYVGEPCVVEIDQESNYEITYLADDFKSFVEGLFEEDDDCDEDDCDEDEEL